MSLGINVKTVKRYYRSYKERGINGYLELKYVGREEKLTKEQWEILETELENYLYANSEEVAQFIKERFNIKYSLSGIRDLLRRHGYVYKRAKLVPGKADKKKQQAFVALLAELMGSKKADEVVYFLDGCHPTHKTRPCYGWIKKGVEYEIPTNTGRERVNINGALNAEDPKEVYTDITDRVNAQSTIRLLEKISKNNPDKKKIYIISDNARYYYCKILKKWLVDHPQIEWKWLPPYSPNLNIIERLWRFMQKKILNGYYYETYSKFKASIISFFEDIPNYGDELKKLMVLNFHIIETDFSGQSFSS